MREKAKIIIATHKKYKMPDEKVYLPLHVGSEGKCEIGYRKDNEGNSISNKNSSYCELTGMYWAWKNLDADFIGLVHYRRHFGSRMRKNKKDKFERILTTKEVMRLIEEVDIIVPKKRRYFIETLYSHYEHTHYIKDLNLVDEIICEKYSEYNQDYIKIINSRSGYMFNMMIMKSEYFNQYCEWLFDILGELEKKIDISEYSDFQKRIYGRISEIIFNVWIEHQIRMAKIRKEKIKEIPYIHIENTNWICKGKAFLKAKFMNEKYTGSF